MDYFNHLLKAKKLLTITVSACLAIALVNCSSSETVTPPVTTDGPVDPVITTTAPAPVTTGVTTPPPPANEPDEKPEVADLYLFPPGMPGMTQLILIIQPLDSDGKTVIVEGEFRVKVWEAANPATGEKGAFLEEWDSVHITEEDYDLSYGEFLVLLPYRSFEPDWGQQGIVEIELKYEHGLVRIERVISLRKPADC